MERNEDVEASASGSSSQSPDQSSVDLEVRNHDLFVAGSSSAAILKTDQSTNVEIKDSNIHIIGDEAMITKGQVATTNVYGNVNIFSGKEHTDAAPSSSSVPTGTPIQPLPDTSTAIAPVYKGNSPGFFQRLTEKLFGGARSFIDYFNRRTWEQTAVNVTESYKEQNLEEPEFEVNPKLIKVTGFYRGQMAPDVTEYRKEQEFAVTEANENIGEVISPNELVQQLCEGGDRCVGLVGQAGGGKTTMMKRTARGVLVANELDNESKAKMGWLARLFRKQKNGFKFVHHLNFRDLLVSYGLTPEEALTPCTLLFGKFAPNLSNQTLRAGYKWLQQHQSEAIFFIDGLDQATWNLEGKYNKMTYTDRSSTATIMFNILSGNLFPDVTLVISSREHRMASLPLELRPPLVIALAGLERDDTKKLFTAVVGETGEESWNKMTFQSPALVPLSSVPLFLIFNAIVHKSNPENIPNTMTDVMTKVLHIFIRSSHIQEQKKIEGILHNLMKMSFEGTREKRVIFNIKDLKNAGLTKEMISDLIIEVPGGSTLLNQHLLEGDTLMFFSHQILQEMLAALYIANMDLATFQAFVTNEIHKDHWSVVLRLLCGTVFDQKIKAQFIKDLTTETGLEKQNCLKHALTTKINQCTKSYQKLELFGALYEANDAELIRSHVQEINFENESFTAAGMCAMSGVMRRCGHLEQVRLVNCELNAELLKNFEFNLKGSEVKVSEFDISLNPMSVEAFDSFGSVLTNIEVEKLVMRGCSLTEEKLRVLGRHFQSQIRALDIRTITNMTFDLYFAIVKFASEHDVKELLMDAWDYFKASKEQLLELSKWKVFGKIRVLDIRTITNMTFDLYLAIAKFASKHDVKELLMDPWDCFKASKEQLLELSKWKVCGKISIIDISQNSMDEEAFGALGDLLSNNEVDQLNAKNCQLTKAKLDALGSHSGLKLSRFDISENPMDEKGFNALGFALKTNTKVLGLVMQNCQLNKEKLDALGSHSGLQISVVDISQNPMDEEAFIALGVLLSNYEVDQLIARNCRLTKAKLDALGSDSGLKILKLDVSQNSMNKEAFNALGSLSNSVEVDELIMRNCQLTKTKLDAFGSHSGLKLSKFDISENPMDENGFNALGSLLTANNKVIDLVMQNCQLTKEKLDALGSHSGLKICTLDIRFITGMTFDLFLAISKFASENDVKELLMDPWKEFRATKDQIMELSKWKVCGKLDVLNVSKNKDLGTAGFGKVGTVVSKCHVKALVAWDCNLTAEGMKAFKQNTRNTKLDVLNVSNNKDLGTAGFGKVGSVVSKCQVKELMACNCNLTAEGMKAFKESTRNTKLDKLVVSNNKNLGTYGFGEVGLVVTKCQVKELSAWDCNLTAEGIKAFKESTSNAKLDSLNVSHNNNLGIAGFGELGLVVSQCQVEAFEARSCNLTAAQMEAFKEKTHIAKLDILNISWNENLGTSGFGKVGLVVSKCHVKELKAWGCNLTAEGINAFKESTSNAKIKCLDLNHNKLSKFGDEGLSTISEIVRQCQVEKLYMWGCRFNDDQLERFEALIADTEINFYH
uniref:NLR family CARD domain-containing protein 3-like n=1 Tax=Styela clava TaxID=7725 RepID=UPI00193ADCCD|nr:NLR family CARD domain-containing protein 3-like [Styela clava]